MATCAAETLQFEASAAFMKACVQFGSCRTAFGARGAQAGTGHPTHMYKLVGPVAWRYIVIVTAAWDTTRDLGDLHLALQPQADVPPCVSSTQQA